MSSISPQPPHAPSQHFTLHSPFPPAGDQPEAIRALVAGVEQGMRHQTLLGGTATGKTYSA